MTAPGDLVHGDVAEALPVGSVVRWERDRTAAGYRLHTPVHGWCPPLGGSAARYAVVFVPDGQAAGQGVEVPARRWGWCETCGATCELVGPARVLVDHVTHGGGCPGAGTTRYLDRRPAVPVRCTDPTCLERWPPPLHV